MTATQRTTTGPRFSGSRFFASPCRAPQQLRSRRAGRCAARKLASGFFRSAPAPRARQVAAQLTRTHQENAVTVVTIVLGCVVAPNNSSSGGDKFWSFGFGTGAGGAAAGLIENVQNGKMGFWIGKNASVLRSSFNGNGATGGRLIFAGRMASFAQTGGNILGGLGLGVSALQGYDAFQRNDANGMVQAGADITVGVIGFTGPIGWAGSTGYFGAQQLDKWFGITDTVAKVVTADPAPITPLLGLSPQE